MEGPTRILRLAVVEQRGRTSGDANWRGGGEAGYGSLQMDRPGELEDVGEARACWGGTASEAADHDGGAHRMRQSGAGPNRAAVFAAVLAAAVVADRDKPQSTVT